MNKNNIALLFIALLGCIPTLQGAESSYKDLVQLETIDSRRVADVSSLVSPQQNNTCGPRVADALLKLSSHLRNQCSPERTTRKLNCPPRCLPQDGRGMTGDQLYDHICKVHGPTRAKELVILDTPIDELLHEWPNPVPFQLMSQESRHRLAHQLHRLRSLHHDTPWDNTPILVLLQAAKKNKRGQKISRSSTMNHWVGLAVTPRTTCFVDTYDGSSDHEAVIKLDAPIDSASLTALQAQIAEQRRIEKSKQETTKHATIEWFQQLIREQDTYLLYPLLITPAIHTLATTSISGLPQPDLAHLKSLLGGLSEVPIHFLDQFEQKEVYRTISHIREAIKDSLTMEAAREALQSPVLLLRPLDSSSSSSSESRTPSPAPAIATAQIQPQAESTSYGSNGSDETPRTRYQKFLDWLFCRKPQRATDLDTRGQQAAKAKLDRRANLKKDRATKAALVVAFITATLKIISDLFNA
jgi:hypothetical protein